MRCLILVCLTSSLTNAEERKPKYVHSSPSEGYTVGLPGKPRTETMSLTTVAGVLPVSTIRYDTGSDLVLSVTSATYPREFSAVPADKLFEGILKEMLAAEKADDSKIADLIAGKVASASGNGGRTTATDETPRSGLTLGEEKHPGRQWRIESGKVVVRVRVYLVGTRLYQIMATGSRSGVSGPLAEDLFQTFRLEK